jgi:hypothetical protein
MVDPGTLDITIHQGATFNLDLQFLDSTGNGVNMLGYTVESKIVDRIGTTTIAVFATIFTQISDGKFRLRLTSEETKAITIEGMYDILVTEPSGDKFYLLQGRTKVDTGITGVL